MEDVDGLDGSFAFLLEPKHQVNPLAQCLGDLVRLQCLSVDQDKQTWIVAGPGWQIHVIHPLAILTNTKIKTCEDKKNFYLSEVIKKTYAGINDKQKDSIIKWHEKIMITLSVDQEFWEVEELWDELLHISHRLIGGQAPCGVHWVKRSVRDIKALVWLKAKDNLITDSTHWLKRSPFMTLDTTLAEYIYDHIKRCLGGSEERERDWMKKKKITREDGIEKRKGEGARSWSEKGRKMK